MADEATIDTVRSYSSGLPGRALNSARTHHFVIDSPSGPNEALTSAEAFLAGISSCGVTLVELHAQQSGLPLGGMQVTIQGIRSLAQPADFQAIRLRFEMAGVAQAEAEGLIGVYRQR